MDRHAEAPVGGLNYFPKQRAAGTKSLFHGWLIPYYCPVTMLLLSHLMRLSNVCRVSATLLCSGPPINVKLAEFDLKLMGLDLPISEALTGIVQT